MLCVDGVGTVDDSVKNEIAELSSGRFGSNLQLVVAMDETVAERLVHNSTQRSRSVIGRHATKVHVEGLDDDEFKSALEILHGHRALVMPGGEFAREYRTAWVLRATMSMMAREPEYSEEELAAWLPPLMGVDLIRCARERPIGIEMYARLLDVAGGLVEDAQDPTRPFPLIVAASSAYIIRRDTLRSYLEAMEIDELVTAGYLRPAVLAEKTTPVLLIRTPELMAGMSAHAISQELERRIERDVDDAADWLVGAANSLPLGEVITAQAVLDLIGRRSSVPSTLFKALLSHEPEEKPLRIGEWISILLPDGSVANLRLREDGEVEADPAEHVDTLETQAGEKIKVLDFGGWLLLSHLAGVRVGLIDDDGGKAWLDQTLLHYVGQSEIVLFRPDPREAMRTVPTYEVPNHGSIVNPKAGIVEPITMSMFKFLSTQNEQAEGWVRKSAAEDSMPLLVRMFIALEHMSQLACAESATFSQRMLNEVVRPALSRFPTLIDLK